MATRKKVTSKKKTAGRKATTKGAKRPPGMPSVHDQILIKAPNGRVYILTKAQLKNCSDSNLKKKWGKFIKKAYKCGELPLECCEIEEGVDDWDIWPTNR